MTHTDYDNRSIALSLSAAPGFSFSATVMSHKSASLAPFRRDAEEAVLLRPERLASSRAFLLAIRETPETPAVQVVVRGQTHVGVTDMAEIGRRVTHMLRLEEDLSGFQALWAAPEPSRLPTTALRRTHAPFPHAVGGDGQDHCHH